MEKIVLISLPLEDLQMLIIDCVNSCLKYSNYIPPQPEAEYITRKQTAKILGVSLPTLSVWSKEGLIPSYRIASRVRYKKDEVINSLKSKLPAKKEYESNLKNIWLTKTPKELHFDIDIPQPDISVRLWNILNVHFAETKICDITKKEFLSKRNGGKKSWDEFCKLIQPQ